MTRRDEKTRAQGGLWGWQSTFDAEAVLDRFALPAPEAADGFVTNFLGVRIPPIIHPSLLDRMTGRVEGRPNPGNWHADIAEWAAALWSVEQAKGTYRIVELGCGWGCWLTNMGVVAARRGLTPRLIGVEGNNEHLKHAVATLRLNGLNDNCFALHHAIAGPKSGTALFPTPEAENWGASPELYPSWRRRRTARASGEWQELAVLTLDELAEDGEIDLLHIDIQGGETAYTAANAIAMDRRVKRVLIGTHSRIIDGALMEHFQSRGWRLEMERPTAHLLTGDLPVTSIDGVQMWANPALCD